MFLKLIGCWCVGYLFSGVESQDDRNSGYETRFSDYWNSNSGYSVSNNRPFIGNNNFFGFNERPNDNNFFSGDKEKNFQWGSGTVTNNDNKKEREENNDWQSNAFNSRPNKKKLNTVVNSPNPSQWNVNSNSFNSNSKNKGNSRLPSSGYNSAKPSPNQNNKKPDSWDFSDINNNKKGNDVLESDYEGNSVYSSWGPNSNKKIKPTSNSFYSSGNRESTTQNNKKFGNSKWEENNKREPQRATESNTWGMKNSSQPEREKPTLDTSILDELDKNDWYFGKESNYPKPPFPSTLNIDVSELWNFDKNRKTNQNSRKYKNDTRMNNGNRRNRQIEHLTERMGGIHCECVSVNLCEKEDMIITQEDVKFELRPIEEFICERLTDVCCTNPKKGQTTNRENFKEKLRQLQCGQTPVTDNHFESFKAKPGEFPWLLRVENAEINCSASLIHSKLALTAAHCVTSAQPEELTLKTGIWNSNNEPSQRRIVTKIIQHPDYSSRNPRNDIALLVLETPFDIKNLKTICLPKTNDEWDLNNCIVTGSRSVSGRNSEVLEKERVYFIPQSECQNVMLVTDFWRNYILHDSFMCGRGESARKTCIGDEGGFVICPLKNQPTTYLQIGVVSLGINCDGFGRPGIFTNVLKFLDWINQNYFELGLFEEIDASSYE